MAAPTVQEKLPELVLTPVDRLRLRRTRRPTDFLERLGAGSPRIVRFRLRGQDTYLLIAPDLVRELLVAQGRATGKARGHSHARMILGQGLLTSDGDLHQRQRRMIAPAFHPTRVEQYADQAVVTATVLAEHPDWRDGAVRDVAEDMIDLMLLNIGRMLFGADLTEDAGAVAGALTTLLRPFERRLLPTSKLMRRLRTPGDRQIAAAGAELTRVVERHIAEHRESGDRGDILSMLLSARDPSGEPMPDGQVRDEAVTMMLAGHETSAAALSWTWLFLDENPSVAERLHEEVDRLDTTPTHGDLDRLPWSRAVIAESLRIMPPTWMMSRRLQQDVVFDGWTVPDGSTCIVAQWLTHRDERWWPTPLTFRPERWITPAGKFDETAPGQPPGAYFPFGMGRRVCLGQPFARAELALVLATLTRHWSATLIPGHPIDIRPGTALRPAHGLRMTLHRRP
ncbi:cytochrome P450 [Sphaerisporangium siamense]|uniref:Cytochrome P450 n=1 Tax=Sphaerisporangium siamense TaxID=795645 RepID=A0A7W7D8D2_9ACTN|nr:cytochrome P450 [Sphaerisporangium siamense]MBB4701899.1 cytochrome P450 [Sphaerisporangium siamense]GII84193.1 cytochrome P450 [Sphaerisporangium siamense]